MAVYPTVDDYKDNRNIEWNDNRLRRLRYMLSTKEPFSILKESFVCDEYWLKIGIKMLSWRKDIKHGIKITKHGKYSPRGD